MSEASCRRTLVLAPLLLLAGAAQCPFDIAPCPDLDDICPNLECADYVQTGDGCSMCECVEEEPVACFSDFECANGKRCDTANFCEAAPGCAAGAECDAVCYGRCVDAPTSCYSDADCPDGQLCAYFDNARQAGDDSSGADAAPMAPSGVCVGGDCADLDVALPTCPPGTEPSFVFGAEGCPYPVCVAVDYCRELVPEQCLATPGCALVDEPCACDASTGACDGCTSVQRCVADGDCYSLGVDACLQNPNCQLVGSGGNAGNADDGVSCQVCDTDGTCQPCDAAEPAPPPNEPSDVVCVPRGGDGTCLTDVDCVAGEICQPSIVCGSGCEVGPDGDETCYQECWSERGFCVPSGSSCYDIPPELCFEDPRCELVESAGLPCGCAPDDPNCACEAPYTAVCVPRETSCFADGDCLAGQHCETVTTCPPCDPAGGIGCAAPCYVEGRCVDGPPPPVLCYSDGECAPGQACVEVSVCETCAGQPEPAPGSDPMPPAPCDAVCYPQGVCVNVGGACYSDAECRWDELCDFSQCDGASNLVACPGTCVPARPPGLCQSDDQCNPGERCATELDMCMQNPDDPNGGCWTQCVPVEPAAGALCLESADCGTTAMCRFHPDVCLDDPNSAALVCSGWCAEQCLQVETAALDPESQRCVTFADSCIPPGWIAGGC